MARKIVSLVAAAAVALMLGSSGADVLPGGGEGCIVSNPSPNTGALHLSTCTYKATRQGGYAAHGTWSVKVKRGLITTTYSSPTKPSCQTGVILPGDTITATAGANSVAAAGNPYPSAADSGNVPREACPAA